MGVWTQAAGQPNRQGGHAENSGVLGARGEVGAKRYRRAAISTKTGFAEVRMRSHSPGFARLNHNSGKCVPVSCVVNSENVVSTRPRADSIHGSSQHAYTHAIHSSHSRSSPTPEPSACKRHPNLKLRHLTGPTIAVDHLTSPTESVLPTHSWPRPLRQPRSVL